jgi:tetratricopeptide (TPR) repeat protein
MLTHEELQYLSWLTAEAYEGWGSIIDLGPWLGSSSAALADGLRRAGRSGAVHAFDLFQWSRGYMEGPAPENLPEGADFQFLFQRHTAPFAAWINAEKQDLMHYHWGGGPIEILFVDAAKSWELTNQILRGFGSALVPNKSRVVLQDYRFWYAYWLPLIFDGRLDVWEETESVEYGTTVSFRPLKPLFGSCGVTLPYSDEGFPIDSARAIFRSRIRNESAINRAWFALSFYRKLIIANATAEAEAVREEFQDEIVAAGLAEELPKAEELGELFLSEGWKHFEQSAFEEAAGIARRFLERRGDSHFAQELLACALMELGRLAEAEAALNEALRLAPRRPQVILHRARLRFAQRRYREAEMDAIEAARLCQEDEPVLANTLIVLRMTCETNGWSERLPPLLEELAVSYPKSPIVHLRRAQVLDRMGQRDEAVAALRLVIQLDPSAEDAKQLLASWGI